MERLFLVRILPHVTTSPNFNPYQSAYRRNHSTETSLLFTLDSCFTAMDNGKSTVLLSLDLSAAFDIIDHITLINRLRISFGITGLLDWISSYLAERRLFVQINNARSKICECSVDVPQGSVLAPILFSLYISPVTAIARGYEIQQQQYADDTQLFIVVSNSDCVAGLRRLEECIMKLHNFVLCKRTCT